LRAYPPPSMPNSTRFGLVVSKVYRIIRPPHYGFLLYSSSKGQANRSQR